MNPRTTKVLRPAWALLFAAALACSGGESASTGATTAAMTTGTTSTSSATGKTTGATGTTGAASTSSTSTSTTGAVSSTTGDATATETGCSFLCDTGCGASPGLDGVVRCSVECTVWAQDCPEGQKCLYDFADVFGPVCTPVMGDGVAGEACEGRFGAVGDTCAKGYMCWNYDMDGVGECTQLCTGSFEDPMCPDGYGCNVGRGYFICEPACSPLLQDCQGPEVCIGDPNGYGFVCVLDASGDMAPPGSPCEFANACNPGSMCVNPDFFPATKCEGALGCCAPFCDLDEPDACAGLPAPGVTCVPYHEEGLAPPGLENVGVCGVAP